MNGIENIIARITAEADAATAQIMQAAEREAEEIRKEYEKKSADKRAEIIARGEKIAEEREARLRGGFELAARKETLAKKQELISRAFDAAANKLESLSGDELVNTLAKLALAAADGGEGEIILSAENRSKIGAKLLAKCSENKKLTLSEETREIGSGLILRDGAAEVNCTFRTLVSGLRDGLSREVADVLFG